MERPLSIRDRLLLRMFKIAKDVDHTITIDVSSINSEGIIIPRKNFKKN